MDRALVLDANILIRAVLGRRVSDIIERYHAVPVIVYIGVLQSLRSWLRVGNTGVQSRKRGDRSTNDMTGTP